MKPFIILAALLVATSTALPYGAVSTQYQKLDPHSHSYSYGYADPNSQKHETSHGGVTHGSYSYVDAYGHKQTVSYTADPHTGFKAVGTNLPKAPALPHDHYAAGHSYASHAVHDVHSHGHYDGHYAHGPIHHVTLTHGGVPVDTPEVQHAKAAHAAAHAAAAAASYGHGHHLYKRSLYSGPWAFGGHQQPHVTLTHGGVPVDNPDVQAAKAEHFAAHAKVLGTLGHGHGAPHDTPEVQHAKAEHFAAHAAARSGHGPALGHHVAAHGYHIPVIHNGVPVETPEVQHAKAAHLSALAEASSRAGYSHGHDDGSYDGRYDGHSDGGHYDGGHYDGAHGYAHGHKGPIHIPVIHNGVPVEPAEVQHARAAHLNALAAASHNSGYSGHHGGYEDDGQYRPGPGHY